MRIIADFHLHSKHSRATSPDMEVESLVKWGKIKGINLIGTGDFTHPAYFYELKTKLEPTGAGLFKLKNSDSPIQFILTVEVSNVYSQNSRLRKIHNILFAPSFELVEKLNAKLSKFGKLASDGRPTFGFSSKDLAKMVLDVSPDFFIVPAHAWTPWFSIFGSNSGFDSIEECFGEYAKYIFAIETGLSSDPLMNWRWSALDKITLISNSDAHSPSKLGREANIFDCKLDYFEIRDILKNRDTKKFLYTVEFFPEEGKYHYDGHRDCGILFSPEESKKQNNLCPVCHKKLTIGVMNRVDSLADRATGYLPDHAIPYKNMIPLIEIIGSVFNQGVESKAVEKEYFRLIEAFGSEFNILLDISIEDFAKVASPKVAEGLKKVREGKVKITPGYDGVYGKISLFEEDIEKAADVKPTDQLGLFG